MSRIETEDAAPGVRVLAFNRPEVRNAFDTAMYQEVTAALRAADADEAVGAVVLTGRGTAFTSGQDLAEMAAIATGTAVEGAGQGFMGLLDCLGDISVPLLAAVNGVAVGLGFTLLAHCDLVLVDAGARLRVPFAELGVPAEAASSVLFPAAMGWQQAARVLLTSDWVSGGRAGRARPRPRGVRRRAPCSTRRSPWRRASPPTPAPPPAPSPRSCGPPAATPWSRPTGASRPPSPRCSAPRSASGTLAEFAGQGPAGT